MSIREWFSYEVTYIRDSKVDSCLDSFLVIYAKAISAYFGSSLDKTKNSSELFQYVRGNHLSKVDQMFITWFEGKGLPIIQEILSLTTFIPEQNKDDLIAQINYEKYILEEEMDSEFIDDLRSCLISITNDLPDRFNQSLKYEIFDKINLPKKENEYYQTKIKESAHLQTLLIIS
jgi:hypothetical protein